MLCNAVDCFEDCEIMIAVKAPRRHGVPDCRARALSKMT